MLPPFGKLIIPSLTGVLLLAINLGLAAEASPVTWVVETDRPGASKPSVGHSLFEILMVDREGQVNVPFPISELILKITRETGIKSDLDGAGEIKTALIPVGRSLQRYAADPEFFKYPRAVYAFSSAPKFAFFPARPIADRLFIAYQARSEALEVISYNEQAGRFEFQVVNNYGPGKTPVLEYAERSTCLACHQNHGPIFATSPWDETGANRKIAGQMMEWGAKRYGISVKSSVDTADLFDQSTDRASQIPVFLKFWADGCPQSDPEDAVKCRAALLATSLKFALSGYNRNRVQDEGADQVFRQNIVAVFNGKWRTGLAESDPDIPNRNIFRRALDHKYTVGSLLETKGAHNPETPRKAKKIWKISQAMDPSLDQIRWGISRFFSPGDYAYLDRLLRLSPEKGKDIIYSADCISEPDVLINTEQEFRLDCVLKDGNKAQLDISLLLIFINGKMVGGEILTGMVDQKIAIFRSKLFLDPIKNKGMADGKSILTLKQKGRNQTARLPNGDRLGPLGIDVLVDKSTAPDIQFKVSLSRSVEGKILDQVIADMIQNTLQTDDQTTPFLALRNPVLQRSLIMNELVSLLGGTTTAQCCPMAARPSLAVVGGN